MANRLGARGLGALLITACAAGCSTTYPESEWPPDIGPIPVEPFPEDDYFGESLEDMAFGEDEDTGEAPDQPAGVDATLPASPSTSFERAAECTEKTCTLKEWVPDPAFTKSVLGMESPGALWLHGIAGGSSVVLPKHSDLTVLGVVLAGSVLAKGDEGGANKLDTWGAFRAVGAGITLTAESDAKVLLAVAAGDGTLKKAIGAGKAQAWKYRWKKRKIGLTTVDVDELSPLTFEDGNAHARIAYGDDGPASLSVVLSGQDVSIPVHDHGQSWEHTAVVDGAGTFKAMGKSLTVSPGQVYSITGGAKHGFEPSGTSRSLIVQVYSPSGPEQRYEKLAGQ